MLEGIAVIWAFGIQDGNSIGHHLVGNVVIADDEVNAKLAGVGHFANGFDAAVENNDELHACVASILQSLCADAVAFVVAVGDVIVNV